MLTNWLCKWFGHKWMLIGVGEYQRTFHAVCERCLEKRQIIPQEPSIVPSRPNYLDMPK
jgi:hypothetical protein